MEPVQGVLGSNVVVFPHYAIYKKQNYINMLYKHSNMQY